LLPSVFVEQLQADAGIKLNNRLYTPLVTMWLLVVQRLQGGAPLEAAVLQLLGGLPDSFWPNPAKRIRQWREHGKLPSSNTGAYNQARQGLPLSMVEQSCDRIFEQLLAKTDNRPGTSRAFILDGSTVRTAHSPELCRDFPPGSNQHGEGHWPLLRVLVAHDLQTGLAMRPQWGALNGPHAVSEQQLLERAMDRLPAGSTVLGDANFGVFSVAYASTQRSHPVVLRLTTARARRLAGGLLQDGIDREIVWTPTRDDRRSHPQLPNDASVSGRLVVRQVQPTDGKAEFLLALFFTRLTSQEAFELYGQRWSIETDLRTLKSTLHLDQLTCTTTEMLAKEIDMGIVAYNLVRSVIVLASQQSGIPPRGYSFTKVRRIVEAFAPQLASAPNAQTAQRIFDQIMQCVHRSKLPHRKRKRPSYPREVWKKGAAYPSRKTRRIDA